MRFLAEWTRKFVIAHELKEKKKEEQKEKMSLPSHGSHDTQRKVSFSRKEEKPCLSFFVNAK